MTAAVQGREGMGDTCKEATNPVRTVQRRSSAFQSFLMDLVASHSDEESVFEIVMDNPKSGETAAKWNQIRRSSLQHSSCTPTSSTHSRWSSDSIVASSPQSNHKDFTDQEVRRSLLTARRNSFDTSLTGRPALQPQAGRRGLHPTMSFDSLQSCMPVRKVESNMSVNRTSPSSNVPVRVLSPRAIPTRKSSSFASTYSEESDFSDYFQSDGEEHEQKRKKASKLKPKATATPTTAECALGNALISTIERLSVRAALTLCRPQVTPQVQFETMETIQEALALLPTRGSVTDIPTSQRRSSLGTSTMDDDAISESDNDTPTHSPMLDPETRSSKQHSDLNNAMLAAIDRLSVRAALTDCYTGDDDPSHNEV